MLRLTAVMGTCLLLSSVIGCGRIAFTDQPDAPPGDASADTSCIGMPFGPAQPVAGIHVATYDDWGGSPNAAGDELYFHSYRPASMGGSNVFVARGAQPNSYGTPVELPELGGAGGEFQPTVTGDSLDLIFSADRGDPYLLELWETQRATTAATWSAPARIAELGTDTQHELDPWLTADGLTLYYAKGPDLTQARLYRATRASRTSAWNPGQPVAGLAGIGSFAVSPTLSQDEHEIYFATDLLTPGDLDVVHAQRAAVTDPFGPIERVAALSTPGDDAALHMSADGHYLFFVLNSDYAAGGNSTISFAARSCQ